MKHPATGYISNTWIQYAASIIDDDVITAQLPRHTLHFEATALVATRLLCGSGGGGAAADNGAGSGAAACLSTLSHAQRGVPALQLLTIAADQPIATDARQTWTNCTSSRIVCLLANLLRDAQLIRATHIKRRGFLLAMQLLAEHEQRQLHKLTVPATGDAHYLWEIGKEKGKFLECER